MDRSLVDQVVAAAASVVGSGAISAKPADLGLSRSTRPAATR